jgi:SAM-dependent methyltransferase
MSAQRGRKNDDPFGEALWAHWNGSPAISIIERDDGYFDAEDVSHYFAEFRSWPPQQRRAMDFVRGRVLDVGCGAGCHALRLQSKGHEVVGIDASPLAIRVCRARGLQKADVLRVTELSADLGTFATILMMGNNLGLLGNRHRAGWLLRKFARLTTDEGRVVAETSDPSVSEDPFHRRYRRTNVERGRMPGRIRMRLRYQVHRTDWFDYLLLSPSELHELVAPTPWQVTEILESDGPTYVAVLTKGGTT